MKRSSVVVTSLAIALVVSNAAWAINAIDVGISRAYARDSYDTTSDALNRAIAVLPVVAKDRVSRDEILKAARLKDDSAPVFEKDGLTWVGELGLQFDASGRLAKACAGACEE